MCLPALTSSRIFAHARVIACSIVRRRFSLGILARRYPNDGLIIQQVDRRPFLRRMLYPCVRKQKAYADWPRVPNPMVNRIGRRRSQGIELRLSPRDAPATDSALACDR